MSFAEQAITHTECFFAVTNSDKYDQTVFKYTDGGLQQDQCEKVDFLGYKPLQLNDKIVQQEADGLIFEYAKMETTDVLVDMPEEDELDDRIPNLLAQAYDRPKDPDDRIPNLLAQPYDSPVKYQAESPTKYSQTHASNPHTDPM